MDCDKSTGEQPSNEKINEQLTKAVSDNDLDKFKSLLESSIYVTNPESSVEERNDILYLSFKLAAERGHSGIVDYLLTKEGIQVNKRNPQGLTALHLASENGHLQIVKSLLEYKHIEVWLPPSMFSFTNPLHLAAKNGHLLIVKALLEKRDIRVVQYYYDSCDSSDEEQTAFFIDSPDRNNQTPLHLAANNGHGEIVKYLLMMRAEITLNANKDTPLHLAAKEGHAEVVELLLNTSIVKRNCFFNDDDESRPCVIWRNEDRMNPVHLASERGHDRVVGILLNHHEVEVNAICSGKSTALHLATKGGHSEAMRRLLEHPKINNLKDISGKTALNIAQEKGDWLCVQILQKRFKK